MGRCRNIVLRRLSLAWVSGGPLCRGGGAGHTAPPPRGVWLSRRFGGPGNGNCSRRPAMVIHGPAWPTRTCRCWGEAVAQRETTARRRDCASRQWRPCVLSGNRGSSFLSFLSTARPPSLICPEGSPFLRMPFAEALDGPSGASHRDRPSSLPSLLGSDQGSQAARTGRTPGTALGRHHRPRVQRQRVRWDGAWRHWPCPAAPPIPPPVQTPVRALAFF